MSCVHVCNAIWKPNCFSMLANVPNWYKCYKHVHHFLLSLPQLILQSIYASTQNYLYLLDHALLENSKLITCYKRPFWIGFFCNYLEFFKCWIWLTNELLARFNHNQMNQSCSFIHGSKVQKSTSIHFLIGATRPYYTCVTPTHWWLFDYCINIHFQNVHVL
jgi:hypothetical protein